jgi:hypothetical protein
MQSSRNCVFLGKEIQESSKWLSSRDASDAETFQLHPSLRPRRVLVSKGEWFEAKLRRHQQIWCSAHLAALVGLCNAQYANFTGVEGSNSPLSSLDASIDGDDHDFERLCCQTRLYRPAEGFSLPFNGRYDDSDIFVGVIGAFGYGNRFVCPIGNQVDNKSKVTENAGDGGKHMASVEVRCIKKAYKSKIAAHAQHDNSMTKNESGSSTSVRSRILKEGLQGLWGSEVYEHAGLGCVAVQSCGPGEIMV